MKIYNFKAKIKKISHNFNLILIIKMINNKKIKKIN